MPPIQVPMREPSAVTMDRIVGDYTLGKTLQRADGGKVKVATHNITGEKFAVKILPWVNRSVAPNAAAGEAHRHALEEVRALREVAVSEHLYHPHICGIREIIIHKARCYVVREYVNGEQMLDYVIRRGRLKERVARGFLRQIGSALEYCHRNNVVHRDIKIENILVSETGDIKVTDFGLSNLYDPFDHLSTFCGTVFFPAPELLSAKVYTGPEVDVWNFGIVMYILVCGKVPFDDESMPALHAKVKRGLVEYPAWLSTECKHLLSRMLAVNPSARVTITEVLTHPWMVRGFNGPPDAHLPHREPLQVEELEKQVISRMTGFGFGSEEEIERRLMEVLNSDGYRCAVQLYERKRIPGGIGVGCSLHESVSNPSLTIPYAGSSSSNTTPSPKRNKHFLAFDFCLRRLFPRDSVSSSGSSFQSHISKPSDPPVVRTKNKFFSGFSFSWRRLFSSGSSPPTSRSLSQSHRPSSLLDCCYFGPTNGFHPLISMYFLAREKLGRERVYGPGTCTSSQSTLNTVVVKDDTDKERKSSSRMPTPETSHDCGASYSSQTWPTMPSPAEHAPSA